MTESTIEVADENAMLNLGGTLAKEITDASVVFLEGELGAGKTTLVSGLLFGYGYCGVVTSPTYSLVTPYRLADKNIYHLDLFRLNSPQELELIGIRDLIDGQSIILIEWPDRGSGFLPAPDYEISISYFKSGRIVRINNKSSSHITRSK